MNLIRSFFKVFFLFPLNYVARYTAACAATLGPSIVLPCNLDTATEWIIGVNCTIVKSTITTSSYFAKTVLQYGRIHHYKGTMSS